MIECRAYTLTELKNTLNISKRQWDERKDEVLEHMKFFFDYEIKLKGRTYCFNIKEQYAEYEPLPRKGDREAAMQFYAKEVDHILLYKPRNTGANLAREITFFNNQYNHQDVTAANYIRPYLKENYTVHDKEWCRINYDTFSYDVITPEQLKFLNAQFSHYLNSESVANVIADIEAGYQSKEEGYACLKNNYDKAMAAFKQEYGFRPYKAGELKRGAWTDENNS